MHYWVLFFFVVFFGFKVLDVTNIDCKVNDEVYIWDNELITLDDIAEELGTISYEIISSITDRVERVFVI